MFFSNVLHKHLKKKQQQIHSAACFSFFFSIIKKGENTRRIVKIARNRDMHTTIFTLNCTYIYTYKASQQNYQHVMEYQIDMLLSLIFHSMQLYSLHGLSTINRRKQREYDGNQK